LSSFKFNARTIDGDILTTPKQFSFDCGQAIPVGMQVVRGFDENFCSLATRVLLVRYGGKTFGSNDFSSKEQFLSYIAGICVCCPEPETGCFLTVNDCVLTVNGCGVLFECDCECVYW
jgi:hypothetical protein